MDAWTQQQPCEELSEADEWLEQFQQLEPTANDGGPSDDACQVCQATASGRHYGARTCEGCKGFFKRSLALYRTYHCYFGWKCVISPQTRSRCKACRFRMCLTAGMSLDGIRMGRVPKGERQKKVPSSAEPEVASTSFRPAHDPSVVQYGEKLPDGGATTYDECVDNGDQSSTNSDSAPHSPHVPRQLVAPGAGAVSCTIKAPAANRTGTIQVLLPGQLPPNGGRHRLPIVESGRPSDDGSTIRLSEASYLFTVTLVDRANVIFSESRRTIELERQAVATRVVDKIPETPYDKFSRFMAAKANYRFAQVEHILDTIPGFDRLPSELRVALINKSVYVIVPILNAELFVKNPCPFIIPTSDGQMFVDRGRNFTQLWGRLPRAAIDLTAHFVHLFDLRHAELALLCAAAVIRERPGWGACQDVQQLQQTIRMLLRCELRRFLSLEQAEQKFARITHFLDRQCPKLDFIKAIKPPRYLHDDFRPQSTTVDSTKYEPLSLDVFSGTSTPSLPTGNAMKASDVCRWLLDGWMPSSGIHDANALAGLAASRQRLETCLDDMCRRAREFNSMPKAIGDSNFASQFEM